MTTDIRLVPTTLGLLIGFLHRIRLQDYEEVTRRTGKPIGSLLLNDLRNTYIVMCGRTMIGWGGVDIIEELEGSKCKMVAPAAPWLLLDYDVQYHQVAFLKWSKRYCKELLKTYGVLSNAVFPENTLALKWLEWLGADIDPTDRLEDGSIPFMILDKEGE